MFGSATWWLVVGGWWLLLRGYCLVVVGVVACHGHAEL